MKDERGLEGEKAVARVPDPRTVLARHGLFAKKSWGQNFLVDRRIVARIVQAVGAGADDVVVEIGAGLGTLTAALLGADPAPHAVLAIERDPEMLAVLHAELGTEPHLDIRAQDAAHFDFQAAAAIAGRPLLVVGNLPYQITAVLLFALIDAGASVSRAVVMVQREVAERIAAGPGGKVYGRLSVMVQHRMEARLLFHVPPGAFHPQPRVTSSVISLVRRPVSRAGVVDEALFAEVVKSVFSTRRKMLRRSLAGAFGERVSGEALTAAGVDGSRRPEELTIEELGKLAAGVEAVLPPGSLRARVHADVESDLGEE